VKKIPTLFVRYTEGKPFVTRRVRQECEWVLAGEGVALRQLNGVCVMKDAGDYWWARRVVPADVAAPPSFKCEEFDRATGRMVGWIPMAESQFVKVFEYAREASPTPNAGTYELIAPEINGNPEGVKWPGLVYHKHAQRAWELSGVPLTYDGLREWFTASDFTWEGVVWHHPGDGRMAKLKKKDFPKP
jgi:hypothetical protein